ncbi:hypothetical protein WJ09_26810 [Burkholderia vietnamiensis]|nr:hypothetical protein WJ04_00205 [Burkholderia vietnamiensis]KVF40322.1 hypothetical protein WJ09_26810 [Burkholderia vietnamiensis]
MVCAAYRVGFALLPARTVGRLATQRALDDRLLERLELLIDSGAIQRSRHQLLDEFRAQVHALAQFIRHFLLAFA